jgi:hypothetical protein
VELVLLRGEICLIDEADFSLIHRQNWYKDSGGYAASWDKDTKTTLLMHRIILNVPKGLLTDHRDRNRLNNQRYNLRIATQCVNQGNAWWNSPTKTSQFKGVHFCSRRKKWCASIRRTFDGVRTRTNLGRFDSETEAARAYNAAALEHFGEGAWLNPV